MALGDTDEMTCSQHGRQNPVVLYCHTCQVLLCTRCVSHGPAGEEPAHRDHTYLQIRDAHDMFKADLTKLVGKLCDELQQKKAVKVELQNRIQKLKIELLRKKTMLTRRSIGFQDTVKMKEAEFGRCLESVLQPAIERNEQRYRDVDYDIVSGDGLVGTAASLQTLPTHKAAAFLRNFNGLRRSIEEHILKLSAMPLYEDELQELQDFLLINLNFHKERKILSHAFLCPQKEVAVPPVLRDWSTVGSTSASVVWRCNSNVQNVDAFLLYYRPLYHTEKRWRAPPSLDPAHLTTLSDVDLCSAGFSRIRIHRFVPKRSQAVLRDLQAATDYVLILFAVNLLARSPPSVFFFQTAPADDDVYKRTLSRRRPVGLPLCECLVALTARVIRVTLYVLLFCYFIVSALLIIVYRDIVYSDLCYIMNWTQLAQISEVVCPVSNAEPSVSAPQMVQESPSYFAWLYNVIDGVALSLFDASLDDSYNRGTS